MNIVMAMDMGADDFIPKPFDLSVLTAKVRALLRRTYHFAGSQSLIEHRGAVLDLNEGTLTIGEQKAELTRNEFRILKLLMEQRGQAVSRDAIMTHLWQSDSFIDDNTLTVNINRLRNTLEKIGVTGYLSTHRGRGYSV